LLKDFGISPFQKHCLGRGYQADDFKDAWSRHLPLHLNKIVINARKTETVKTYILTIFFIYAGLTAGLLKEGFVKTKNAF